MPWNAAYKSSMNRSEHINEIVANCRKRILEGEAVDVAAIVQSNHKLMPELEECLLGLMRVPKAPALTQSFRTNVDQPDDNSLAEPCLTGSEFVALAERTLDPSRQARVRAHFQRCQLCREEWEDRQELHYIAQRFQETETSLLLPNRMPLWQPGDVIPGVGIIKEVHAGGMARVYRVYYDHWDRDVAVKIPCPKAALAPADAEQFFSNFVDECRTWLELGPHPHIVYCGLVRELQGYPAPCVLVEYVEGGTLADWIREHKLYDGDPQRTLERMLDIAIQICWGLYYAHENHLVHQDVKPSNVMVTADAMARVTDFGLARSSVAGGSVSFESIDGTTGVSVAGGTREYCSPEHVTANKQWNSAAQAKLTLKADIWSWGLTVLEMFAGGCFWGQGTAQCIKGSSGLSTVDANNGSLRTDLAVQFPGISARKALRTYLRDSESGAYEAAIPRMPEPLAKLLRWCFEERAENRPNSMGEVAANLIAIYEQVSNVTYPRPQPPSVSLQADNHVAKGLSQLTLDDFEKAETLFCEALGIDPLHLWARHNYNLLLWADGRATDDQVTGQLQALTSVRNYREPAMRLFEQVEDLRNGRIPPGDGHTYRDADDSPSKEDGPQVVYKGVLHAGKVTGLCFVSGGRLVSTGSDARLVIVDPARNRPVAARAAPRYEPISSLCSRGAQGRLAIGGSHGSIWLFDIQTTTFSVPDGWKRHSDCVRAVSISGTGDWVASASWDHKVIVQRTDGRSTARSEDAGAPAEAITLTGENNAIYGAWNGRVHSFAGNDLIDAPDEVLPGSIYKGAFPCALDSTDSAGRLLCGYSDGRLCLTDIGTHERVEVACGPRKGIESCFLTADGRLGASGGWDCAARLWAFERKRDEGMRAICLRTFGNGSVPVTAVAMSDDATLLAFGDLFGHVEVWNLGKLADVRVPQAIRSAPKRYPPPPPPNYAALEREAVELRETKDKALSQARSEDFAAAFSTMRQWQSKAGRETNPEALRFIEDEIVSRFPQGVRRLPHGVRRAWPGVVIFCESPVLSLTWAPDGKALCAGLEDGFCREYNSDTAVVSTEYPIGRAALPMGLAFSSSGGYLAAALSARILQPKNPLCVWRRGEPHARNPIVLSHGERVGMLAVVRGRSDTDVYCTGWDGKLWKVECDTARFYPAFQEQTNWGSSLQLSSSRKLLSGACGDGAIRLWDLAENEMIVEFLGQHAYPTQTTLAGDDEQWLVSGDITGGLCCFNWRATELLGRWQGHVGQVMGVAQLAEPAHVVSLGEDGRLILWDLRRQRYRELTGGEGGPARCLAVSPDGRRLAVGRNTGSIEIWDFDWLWSGEEVCPTDWASFHQCPVEQERASDRRIVEDVLYRRIIAERQERDVEVPWEVRVQRVVADIHKLNSVSTASPRLKRFALEVQSYWAGSLGEFSTCLDAAQAESSQTADDGMLWTLRGMALSELHRQEEAYDATRLAADSGFSEAQSLLGRLREVIRIPRTERATEPTTPSACRQFGVPPPRITSIEESMKRIRLMLGVAVISWLLVYRALAGGYLPQLAHLMYSVSTLVAAVGGVVAWTHFSLTRFRRQRRATILTLGNSDRGVPPGHYVLEKDLGEPNSAYRVLNATLAGCIWSLAVATVFYLAAPTTHLQDGISDVLRAGIIALCRQWWLGIGLLMALVLANVGFFHTRFLRRIVWLGVDADRPEPEPVHLPEPRHSAHGVGQRPIRFMPTGPVVILDVEDVRSVNPRLASRAACPRCESRELLWYQYSSKNLSSGASVYIRCQQCGNDEYTDL